jgi:alkanesulfonate monooxygenase
MPIEFIEMVGVKPKGADGAPAHRIGGKHADVCHALGRAGGRDEAGQADVRAGALPFGHEPRFSVSVRPTMMPTEARACDSARRLLAAGQAKQGDRTLPRPQAVGEAPRWRAPVTHTR